MAHEIKLEILTFGIRKLRDTDSYQPLNKVGDEDFYEAFKNFLSTLELGLQSDEPIQSAFRLRTDSLVTGSVGRTYRGIFESGHYGLESDLENLDTKKRRKKGKRDVELMPFYFLIHIPNDADKGILMLQRFGIFGTTAIVKRKLDAFVDERYQSLKVDFNPLVTKELAKEFLDEKVKEIVLTKHNLPSDIADRIGLGTYKKDMQSIEIRIKAKRQSFFKKSAIKNFVNDPNTKFLDAKYIGPLGFDGKHEIKLLLTRKGGSARTVHLENTGDIKPYYVIDADVKKHVSGYPEFKSIDKIAMDFLAEMK